MQKSGAMQSGRLRETAFGTLNSSSSTKLGTSSQARTLPQPIDHETCHDDDDDGPHHPHATDVRNGMLRPCSRPANDGSWQGRQRRGARRACEKGE
jgi:hypothetical protein